MEKTFFNLTESEFKRRARVRMDDQEPVKTPISDMPALEACVEGSKKLLEENGEMMKGIYRSIGNSHYSGYLNRDDGYTEIAEKYLIQDAGIEQ